MNMDKKVRKLAVMLQDNERQAKLLTLFQQSGHFRSNWNDAQKIPFSAFSIPFKPNKWSVMNSGNIDLSTDTLFWKILAIRIELHTNNLLTVWAKIHYNFAICIPLLPDEIFHFLRK